MTYPYETMCSDLDPGPYIKGQGHTGEFNVRVHMLVSRYKPYLALKLVHDTVKSFFSRLKGQFG